MLTLRHAQDQTMQVNNGTHEQMLHSDCSSILHCITCQEINEGGNQDPTKAIFLQLFLYFNSQNTIQNPDSSVFYQDN